MLHEMDDGGEGNNRPKFARGATMDKNPIAPSTPDKPYDCSFEPYAPSKRNLPSCNDGPSSKLIGYE